MPENHFNGHTLKESTGKRTFAFRTNEGDEKHDPYLRAAFVLVD